ncbi:MAG: type II toxin-antitoxin system HicA family toxin [Micrococcales bacterium]|nr:type II toxin-antitoxin system HicA family toxin [Micrococcales bacterium]
MAKPMKYKDLAARLRAAGCTSAPGRGDHEKWYCPCGQHMAVVTRPGTVSAGVVRDVVRKLECLPGGWWQR